MKRITDLNGLFLRDDFTHNAENEISLDVAPAQGLYLPKWDGTAWVEGMAQADIDALKAQATPTEPTQEERLTTVETVQDEIIDTLAVAMGVML